MQRNKTLLALTFALLTPLAAQAQPVPGAVPGNYPGPGERRAPPAPRGPSCEPDCRPGFYCKAGTCKSLCNPACGPGEYCTDQRMCALVPAGPPAAPPAPPAPPADGAPPAPQAPPEFPYQPPPEAAATARFRMVVGPEDVHQRREQERLRKEEGRQRRIASRLIPRLTLGGGFGFSALDPHNHRGGEAATMGALALTVGGRKHFLPFVGIDVKATGLLGQASVTDENGSSDGLDHTDAWALSLQAGPIFTPFWRLYLGPVLAINYRHFRRNVLNGFYDSFELHSGGHTSIGGQLGLGLLNKEQLDLNLQVTGDEHGQIDVLLTAAFHFVLGQL
jgi:hypothetical protein